MPDQVKNDSALDRQNSSNNNRSNSSKLPDDEIPLGESFELGSGITVVIDRLLVNGLSVPGQASRVVRPEDKITLVSKSGKIGKLFNKVSLWSGGGVRVGSGLLQPKFTDFEIEFILPADTTEYIPEGEEFEIYLNGYFGQGRLVLEPDLLLLGKTEAETGEELKKSAEKAQRLAQLGSQAAEGGSIGQMLADATLNTGQEAVNIVTGGIFGPGLENRLKQALASNDLKTVGELAGKMSKAGNLEDLKKISEAISDKGQKQILDAAIEASLAVKTTAKVQASASGQMAGSFNKKTQVALSGEEEEIEGEQDAEILGSQDFQTNAELNSSSRSKTAGLNQTGDLGLDSAEGFSQTVQSSGTESMDTQASRQTSVSGQQAQTTPAKVGTSADLQAKTQGAESFIKAETVVMANEVKTPPETKASVLASKKPAEPVADASASFSPKSDESDGRQIRQTFNSAAGASENQASQTARSGFEGLKPAIESRPGQAAGNFKAGPEIQAASGQPQNVKNSGAGDGSQQAGGTSLNQADDEDGAGKKNKANEQPDRTPGFEKQDEATGRKTDFNRTKQKAAAVAASKPTASRSDAGESIEERLVVKRKAPLTDTGAEILARIKKTEKPLEFNLGLKRASDEAEQNEALSLNPDMPEAATNLPQDEFAGFNESKEPEIGPSLPPRIPDQEAPYQKSGLGQNAKPEDLEETKQDPPELAEPMKPGTDPQNQASATEPQDNQAAEDAAPAVTGAEPEAEQAAVTNQIADLSKNLAKSEIKQAASAAAAEAAISTTGTAVLPFLLWIIGIFLAFFLFVAFFVYIGCNYPIGKQPVIGYSLSIMGQSGYGEICQGVDNAINGVNQTGQSSEAQTQVNGGLNQSQNGLNIR